MKALAAFKVPQPRLPISRQGNSVHAWENILLQTCKVVKSLGPKQPKTCPAVGRLRLLELVGWVHENASYGN